MTERDTDIEFDFFDEPETEEAPERVRAPRRQPPRGPRRPLRPPSGLIPMLRLAGLIAFLILAVVLLVVGVRSCASSGKHARYEGYIQDVRGIARRNDQISKDLNAALSATGIKETDLEAKINGLAAQEQQEVATAGGLTPFGRRRRQRRATRPSLDGSSPTRRSCLSPVTSTGTSISGSRHSSSCGTRTSATSARSPIPTSFSTRSSRALRR